MNSLPQPIRVAAGLFTLLAFLAGVGWVLWRCLKSSDDPVRLIVRWVATLIVLGLGGYACFQLAGDGSQAGQIGAVLAGAVLGLILAIFWVPALIDRVAGWFGSLYTGGTEAPTPMPAYSIAEARRKQGLHHQALHVIQEQLARFPTDVTGQMMMAEVQAENLQDLTAAQATIERFLAQDHAPRNVAYALNSLADWHLKLARDPDAAREALERIITLLPGSEESQNAAQRIGHLASREELGRRDKAAPIVMAAGLVDVGLRSDAHLTSKTDEAPDAALARLTAHLGEHPLDREAREKLALLYMESFQDLDAAIGQFEYLAQMPNQTPRDMARWINRISDLQVQQGQSFEIVSQTLQRIVDSFPGLAPAELARQRLETLRLELKGKEKSQVVKLGSYEKDLGLRMDGPPEHH